MLILEKGNISSSQTSKIRERLSKTLENIGWVGEKKIVEICQLMEKIEVCFFCNEVRGKSLFSGERKDK